MKALSFRSKRVGERKYSSLAGKIGVLLKGVELQDSIVVAANLERIGDMEFTYCANRKGVCQGSANSIWESILMVCSGYFSGKQGNK